MKLGKTVEIIEDDEILLMLLKKELERGGYDVLAAKNGDEGLAQIRDKKPDLILLDMLMPVLDGYGVLEVMRQEKLLERTAVIIISNSGQPIELEHLRTLGAVESLVKANMTPSEVLGKIDAFFGITRPSDPKTAAREYPHSGANDPETVLIIEDEEFLVDLLRYKFEERHHRVEVAMSVGRATEILAEQPISLILLDIMLPDMNGFEFLTVLKKDDRFKNIPVIIISNLGQKHDIERGLSLGAVEYIIKANVSPSEIIAHAEDVLARTKAL